ncbi:MAG: putative DNA modification/repair radical SAM protein [Deltaproteobacteria bacterium]|nr:putative DNA modification/repair radical SAM protein [Deltaproteobacteria bacterium]
MAPVVRVSPSLSERLEILGEAARYDLSCSCGPSQPRKRGPDGRWIYPAALPSGKRVPMLKVLQQSGCERGCYYCVERSGGAAGRGASFTPDELARLFSDMHAQGSVFGMFLSSAIRDGAPATMERMLATAEILRLRHRFRGYLHLKVLPGARPDQVERAMQLATRVSVNLEAPNAARLARMAPAKAFESELVAPMRQIARAEAEGRFARSGQTTQLVVGASEETDAEIGRSASLLYGRLNLARVYYSAFQPVPGTPLEGKPPTPFAREHRLYQMDFLLRKYGFGIDEIPFGEDGALPSATDPKTAWAALHPERFPLEVNTARAEELVRVPGIGPVCAARIESTRRKAPIRSLPALEAMGVSGRAAAPYVLLDGRRPPVQLALAV